MADQRRYATLFAGGGDRRQQILAVAQRLVTRNGGRGTTLGQIAQDAGVTRPACCTTSSPKNSCCMPCLTPATSTT